MIVFPGSADHLILTPPCNISCHSLVIPRSATDAVVVCGRWRVVRTYESWYDTSPSWIVHQLFQIVRRTRRRCAEDVCWWQFWLSGRRPFTWLNVLCRSAWHFSSLPIVRLEVFADLDCKRYNDGADSSVHSPLLAWLDLLLDRNCARIIVIFWTTCRPAGREVCSLEGRAPCTIPTKFTEFVRVFSQIWLLYLDKWQSNKHFLLWGHMLNYEAINIC